jgi:hypothetical protein
MSYTEDMKSIVCDFVGFLISEGDVYWDDEDEDEDAQEGESTWKIFQNLEKLHELLVEGRRDEKKIDHIKRFLHMYLFDDEGLLQGSFDVFYDWYLDEYEKEPTFRVNITWMMGYIDSGVWIKERTTAAA